MFKRLTILNIIIIVGLLLLVLFLLHGDTREEKKQLDDIERDIEKKNNEIDSIFQEIKQIESEEKELREIELRIDTLRIVEVEKIKKLPLDSSVIYFKEKLNEYEKKFNP